MLDSLGLRMNAPSLSIVIPTHNTRELVVRCLESLGDAGVEPVEVVVVDDASADGTAEAVRDTHPDAIVVETGTGEDVLQRDLGAAAAYYLETTLKRGDVVGLSSWSSALLAMVDSMRVLPRPTGSNVVQILGGLGSPEAEVHAATSPSGSPGSWAARRDCCRPPA